MTTQQGPVPAHASRQAPRQAAHIPQQHVVTAVAFAVALLATPAGADSASVAPAQHHCRPFSELRLVLERNATDGDTEVVLFAKGHDDGLQRLTVTAPNGRAVVRFNGDKRGIGIREFHLESAEPPDLDAVLQSFPEGVYRFVGQTVPGNCLTGSAYLSHALAPTTTLLTPAENAVVPVAELVLSWSPVIGAEHYLVELNNEDSGSEITFALAADTTTLAIPAALLVPNATYQFAVGVETATGNITFVELYFYTQP